MFYCHAFDIAFELVSSDQSGEDVTPEMLRKALQVRLNTMSDVEIVEACGAPFDTFEMTKEAKIEWETARGLSTTEQ